MTKSFALLFQLKRVYREMIERKITITAQSLKNRINGVDEEEVCRMLIPIFEDHNRHLEALVGKEFPSATVTPLSYYPQTR